MNFTAQIKRGITALVFFSAIGGFMLAHAEPSQITQAKTMSVVSTRAETVAKTAADTTSAHATARVHVGRPVRVSANPTSRQVTQAAR